MSKETLRLFLTLLSKVQICPMAENADQSYEQLKRARDEVLEALKEKPHVKLDPEGE